MDHTYTWFQKGHYALKNQVCSPRNSDNNVLITTLIKFCSAHSYKLSLHAYIILYYFFMITLQYFSMMHPTKTPSFSAFTDRVSGVTLFKYNDLVIVPPFECCRVEANTLWFMVKYGFLPYYCSFSLDEQTINLPATLTLLLLKFLIFTCEYDFLLPWFYQASIHFTLQHFSEHLNKIHEDHISKKQ